MENEIGSYGLDDALAPLRTYLDQKVETGIAHLAEDQFDKLIENRREELLTLALSDQRTSRCDKAFLLLCKPLRKIADMLTHDNLFYLHCGAILHGGCSNISAGRIASILKEIIKTGVPMSDPLFDLLMKLLSQHASNSSVLDLWITAVDRGSELSLTSKDARYLGKYKRGNVQNVGSDHSHPT